MSLFDQLAVKWLVVLVYCLWLMLCVWLKTVFYNWSKDEYFLWIRNECWIFSDQDWVRLIQMELLCFSSFILGKYHLGHKQMAAMINNQFELHRCGHPQLHLLSKICLVWHCRLSWRHAGIFCKEMKVVPRLAYHRFLLIS